MSESIQAQSTNQVIGTRFDADGSGAVVLVLADIVGFSSLCQTIENQTDDAAEKLTGILRSLFSRIAECVIESRGDVLSFGGDSVLIGWRIPSEEFHIGIVNSVFSVCEAIHHLCNQASSESKLDLQMRISLVDDTASWVVLNKVMGGVDCVVWGAAMIHLIECNKNCLPGKTQANASKINPINTLGRNAIQTKNHITSFSHDRRSWDSTPSVDSRQAATVVFVRFQDELMSHEISHSSLRDLSNKLRVCVELHGGFLCRIRMDDKGLNALILWGIRHHSYEDDAVRAYNFSHSTLSKVFPNTQIGITSGRVFTGLIGEMGAIEFTAMGTAVNNAADLSSKSAKDKLLCDHLTFQRLNHKDRWLPVALQLKGMREPQTFYQISELKQPSRFDGLADLAFTPAKSAQPSQSTGRDQEIDLVHRHLAAHGSVSVIAEAGIGKTYLVQAVARGWLEMSGLLVHVKFAADSHQMAFRPILDEMAVWATSLSSKQKKSEELVWLDLASRLPNLLTHELTTISQIIHRQTHQNEPDQQMNALVLQEKIEQIIHEWILVVSRQGKLLICLEDLHWIDAPSSGLLSRMLHQIPNVFWLGTSRQFHSEWEQSKQYRAIDWKSQINLLPLDSSAILCILNRQFPNLQISGEVVSDIFRITNGHALFVTHWINEALAKNRYQIAAESLVKTNYRLLHAPNFEDPPISLHFLLQSQFDRLSEEQRFLVQFLSVLNQRISKNKLLSFLDNYSSSESTLQQCLSTQAQILIEHSSDERDSIVAFNHSLMRDVAYSSLSMVQRQKFHLQIALGLDAGQLFQSDPLIRGWHWMRSHQVDSAVFKAIEAGRYAMAIHSLPQAIQFLSFALNCLEDKPHLLSAQETQQLGLLLAFAQSELGKNQADRELLLRTTRSRYSDTPRLGQTVRIIFNHIAYITRSAFGKSQKDVANHNSLSMQATAQLLLAEIAYFQGDIDALQWHAMCSLDASEQSQSPREQSATYGGISLVCARFGFLWLSDRYAAAALRAARRAHDKSSTVDAVPYICLRGIAIADWENTDRRIIQALRRNEKVGHSRRRNELLIIHGYMLELKGNLSDALQRYRECWRTGVERNDQQTKVWGQLGCSRIYLQLGEWSQTLQIINEIHNASRYDNISQLELASQQIVLAVIHEQYDKLDDLLLRWPIEDLSKFAQISFAYQGFLTIFFLAVMLKINLESTIEFQNKWTKAAVFARYALKLHATQFPVSRPVRALMESLWFANQGKHSLAIKSVRRATDEAVALRMPLQVKNSQDIEALIAQSEPSNTQLSYFCLAAEKLLRK